MKKGIRERISHYIKKNETDLLCSGELDFSLEMFGNSSLFICGINRILKYTESEIILKAKEFNVEIFGKGLNCSVYHVQGIEITGNIEEIRFTNGEKI